MVGKSFNETLCEWEIKAQKVKKKNSLKDIDEMKFQPSCEVTYINLFLNQPFYEVTNTFVGHLINKHTILYITSTQY